MGSGGSSDAILVRCVTMCQMCHHVSDVSPCCFDVTAGVTCHTALSIRLCPFLSSQMAMEASHDDGSSSKSDNIELAVDDGVVVDQTFIESLNIVVERVCAVCNHASSELNPLSTGPHRRCSKVPTWPWLKGALMSPSGKICRICPYVFVLGGFATEHAELMTLKAAMCDEKAYPTLRRYLRTHIQYAPIHMHLLLTHSPPTILSPTHLPLATHLCLLLSPSH